MKIKSSCKQKNLCFTVFLLFFFILSCTSCGSEDMAEGHVGLRNIQFTEKWLEKNDSAQPMAKIQSTDFIAGMHEQFINPRPVRLQSTDDFEAIIMHSPYYAVYLSFRIPKKEAIRLGLADDIHGNIIFENVLKSDEYTAKYVTVTFVDHDGPKQ